MYGINKVNLSINYNCNVHALTFFYYGQVCDISQVRSGHVACDPGEAPRGEWERKGLEGARSLDLKWTAGKDAAF